MPETKDLLARYLSAAREALAWKLEGLSDYDVRRPMTSTGTNLLGLLKHAATVQAGYLGDCMGRPFPDPPKCFGPDAEDNDDMWALPDETRADIEALWARSCAHADATIAALVHLQHDLSRHAGHADIVRELIDGSVGTSAERSNLPDHDADWWRADVERLEETARRVVG